MGHIGTSALAIHGAVDDHGFMVALGSTAVGATGRTVGLDLGGQVFAHVELVNSP